MDLISTCNTKPLEKDTYKKYNKQPKSILFKPLSYKKQSNTFSWKANHKRALFDITSTKNSYINLAKVLWEYVSRFGFAAEAYLYSSTITTIDSTWRYFQYKMLHNPLYLNGELFLYRKHNTSVCSFCNLAKRLWCTVIECFKRNLRVPLLSP